MIDTATSSSLSVAQRLLDAINRHDLDAMLTCFAVDFQNETPAHPFRSFIGRAQVGKNWAQIFSAVPDLVVQMVDSTTAGDAVWTEWDMQGTRVDGSPHHMRGTAIFSVGDGVFQSVRFYLEPVEQGGPDVNAAVQRNLGR